MSPEPPPAELALPLAAELEAFFRRRGHGDDAPDLVQDLFVLLLSKKGVDSSVPGRFRSFLFAVAYRIGANAARRRRFRDFKPALTAPGDTPPSPEEIAVVRERVRRAAAALDALPAEVRRTLLLVVDEGMTTRETARLLGVSEEVVRARLSRGRRRLTAILSEGT